MQYKGKERERGTKKFDGNEHICVWLAADRKKALSVECLSWLNFFFASLNYKSMGKGKCQKESW